MFCAAHDPAVRLNLKTNWQSHPRARAIVVAGIHCTVPCLHAGVAASKLSAGNFTDSNRSVWFLMHNTESLVGLMESAFLIEYDSYNDVAKPKLRQLDWVRG